jgi:tRNA threonylcarbamoyladenosine biosynthesis protein TsaE
MVETEGFAPGLDVQRQFLKITMHTADDISLDLADEAATLALGGKLSAVLQGGLTIWLLGNLGAGKTTLVRGLLRGLGYAGKVKSPTYTLVEPYVISGLYLYHFDLYRFADPEEWDAAGFRDYFNAQSVCLVEWPQQAGGLLPVADLEISLELHGDGRTARLQANTELGRQCLERFSPLYC